MKLEYIHQLELLKENLRLIEEMNQFIDKLEKHIKEV